MDRNALQLRCPLLVRQHGHCTCCEISVIKEPEGKLLGLLRQWAKLCTSNYEQCLFHATALVTFFGAFRISEVVAASKADATGRCLMWDDLQLEDSGMRLRLRRSKTDQAGQGTWVALAPASREELCPIAAMRSYLKSRGSQPGFLFQHANGSPLTKYQFWAVASKALQALGLGECQFGTHSFRIGAASTAAAAGIGEARIKSIGRWRSGAFKSYIR